MSGLEQLYSPREAAELLSLNRKSIYKCIEEGELKAIKLRGRLRIPASSLEAWLERSGL